MSAETTRRRFLGRLAGTLAAPVVLGADARRAAATPSAQAAQHGGVGRRGMTQLVDGRDRAHFHQHSAQPLTLEARVEHFGSTWLTPTRRFFVRNNLPMPDRAIVDNADAWVVEFGGLLPKAAQFTLADLKRLPTRTVAAVIQCSGNGRAFFEHGPSGSQWATGAAGCALWTGVRVADLLQFIGRPAAQAKYMTSTGGEVLPKGVDPSLAVVERSIPIAKGLDDCLLAWEMNGEPVPLSNGGPLRLIVPGYFGVNHIKYVRQIRFTAEQTTAKIQKSGYRFRAIGQKGAPIHPSMWRMPVKSWLVGPGTAGDQVLRGRRRLTGVALSGERGVAKVDYSLDGGRTWQPAELSPMDMGPAAWRVFHIDVDLEPGMTTIATRATDTSGDVQPRARVENERGYGNNSWADHAVTLFVVTTRVEAPAAAKAEPAGVTARAPSKRVTLSEAGARGRALVEQTAQPSCGTCHSIAELGATGKVGPDLDEKAPSQAQVVTAVTQGVGAMPSYRDTLSKAQIRDIAQYIVEATR